MNELLTKFKKELASFEAKEEELYKQLTEELINPLRKEFINLFPTLKNAKRFKTISWTQYTPHWNDGEECYFSANVDYLHIDGSAIDDVEWAIPYIFEKLNTQEEIEISRSLTIKYKLDGNYSSNKIIGQYGLKPNPNYDEHDGAIVNDVQDTLDEIPTDTLKELFGDHVEITLHTNGEVTTQEYEHG